MDMDSQVLKAENVSEDLKEKVFVSEMVFPGEVDLDVMPKPRHICVSEFNGDKWVTKRYDTGEVVQEQNHEMFMFSTLNSGKFTVVNSEDHLIEETVNEISN